MPDRYGDATDTQPAPPCGRPGCRGWLGEDEEGRPIPCLVCKDHLLTGGQNNDYAERVPSARAQAAIDAAEREDETWG